MDQFTYENSGVNTYLVYEIRKEDNVDSMALGMLTNNKIPGLAKTIFLQKDNSKFIKYDVSARVTLQDFFTGQVNKKRLIGAFKGIVDAFLAAEEYMLDTSSIILDLNLIFIDVSSYEVSMIMLPLVGESRTASDVSLFFRDLMYSIQSDVTEDCSHVAKILNYLNSSAYFSLAEFEKVLAEIKDGNVSAPVKPITQIPASNQHSLLGSSPAQQQIAIKQVPPVQAPVSSPAAVPPAVSTPPANAAKVAPPQANSHMVLPQKGPNGMAIPPKQAGANTNANAAPAVTPDGKDISLFYLLQHYNSDNAATYKAQKEAKKAAKANAKPAAAAPAQNKKGKDKKAANKAAAPVVPPVQGVQAVPGAPVAPLQTPVQQPAMNFQPAPVIGNFGETTVLGGGAAGETTVLSQANAASAQQPVNPWLIRIKTSERIAINKNPFRIGKEKSFVEYFIGDNTAVSRSHAVITSNAGSYFLKDTNSTNHTFVNGTMIQSGVEVPLKSGDRIKFANEEFEFKIG